MSSDSEDRQGNTHRGLTQELRQLTNLSAAFFRAAAAKVGLTVTDMQVLDLLERLGPTTAGQLAEFTGLTTGAVTGMLNRLEERNLVRRERDPTDGRRVIVQRVSGDGVEEKIQPLFAGLETAWNALLTQYDASQRTLLLDFVTQSTSIMHRELLGLDETPMKAGETVAAPLGTTERARLVVAGGISLLDVRTQADMTELYQARFGGTVPEVTATDGAVTIRYPRSLLGLGKKQRTAAVVLNVTIPWEILIQGGAADITADLGGLELTSLEIHGGLSSIRLALPRPTGVVPLRISGGASEITVRCPPGVAARAHLKGWVSTFIFDDQMLGNMGNNVWLQSAGFKPTDPYYDIEIASSASMVSITTT